MKTVILCNCFLTAAEIREYQLDMDDETTVCVANISESFSQVFVNFPA